MDPLPQLAPDAAGMGRMLRLARAQPTDAVAIVGPHSLDSLLDLCRSGFAHVTCACGLDRRCVAEPNDLMMICGPLDDNRLSTLIDNAAGLLGPHAAVVAHLVDIDQDRLLESRLAHAGVEVTSTVFDLSAGVLVAHRVARHVQLARAA